MMNFRKLYSSVWTPFVLSIIIQFIFAPFTEQRWDMYFWRLNQVFVYKYGINPFWPSLGAPLEFAWGYPPFWLFVLLLVYPFFYIISPTSYPLNASALWNRYPWSNMTEMFESYRRFIPQNLPVLDLAIKTPIIVANVLIAFFLLRLIKSASNENTTRFVAWIWLFNPYAIWLSAVWGVFDSLPTLFVLLSLYYLFRNKFDMSAIMLSVGTLFKLYPVILVPVFGLIIFKKTKKARGVLRYILISGGITLAATFLTFVVFVISFGQPIELSLKLLSGLFIKRASPDWYGQNIVAGLTPLVILRDLLGSTNIPITPILMGTALLLLLIKLYKTSNVSTSDIIAYVLVAHFIIYMTYTVVNPQYLMWSLPLLLALYALKRSSLTQYLYWGLSFLGIGTILYSYSLSDNISPYFLRSYFTTQISPELLIIGSGLAILYIAAVKIVLRKPKTKIESDLEQEK